MAIELELIIEIIMTKELKATLFEGASDIILFKVAKELCFVNSSKIFLQKLNNNS